MKTWFVLLLLIGSTACGPEPTALPSPARATPAPTNRPATPTLAYSSAIATVANRPNLDFGTRIALAAEKQVGVTTIYDSQYVRLAYPNGDVPLERGVCTDVVIRAFRALGIDLQMYVHQDMARNFSVYPRDWGMTAPDTNIDHRRVQNLSTYFARTGKQINNLADESWKPGDIAVWKIDSWMQHIGIIAADRVEGTNRYYVVHNVGSGTHKEDALHWFTLIGHYRW